MKYFAESDQKIIVPHKMDPNFCYQLIHAVHNNKS